MECTGTSLLALLEARRAQNSTLLTLLPSYLESVADDLSDIEPRLKLPEKRAKWSRKVSVKVGGSEGTARVVQLCVFNTLGNRALLATGSHLSTRYSECPDSPPTAGDVGLSTESNRALRCGVPTAAARHRR